MPSLKDTSKSNIEIALLRRKSQLNRKAFIELNFRLQSISFASFLETCGSKGRLLVIFLFLKKKKL